MWYVDQRSMEVWGLGILPWEIVLLKESGYGGSLGKVVVYGIKLLRAFMGHPNGWDADILVS